MAGDTRFIFVGASPAPVDCHPGGQLTASRGLVEYAIRHAITLDIVDSAQASLPRPHVSTRIRRAAIRFWSVFRLLHSNTYQGAIIFSSAGGSFYEKSALALLCRLFRVKCLLFVRSGHFIDSCRASRSSYWLTRWLLRIPDKLGAQGTAWQEFFVSLGINPEKIVVSRNWLSNGRSVASVPKCGPSDGALVTFLFVGWLVREKGVMELLQAVDRSKLLRASRVLIAGDGTLRDEVACFVEERNLSNVRILGWQTPEQIDGLLQEAHVFVLPSYTEGFPNALLEAISQGLPVVVTPVGGMPDSALHNVNARHVTPGSTESLAREMEFFVENPEVIQSFSKKSLEIASQQHDIETNCRKLFEI